MRPRPPAPPARGPMPPPPSPTPLSLAVLLAAILLGVALAGCAAPRAAAPPPPAPAGEDAPPAGAGPVTAQQAAEIVVERYGGRVTAVDADADEDDHDQPTWRVELRGSDRGDIEGQVDQRTGTLLHLEKD